MRVFEFCLGEFFMRNMQFVRGIFYAVLFSGPLQASAQVSALDNVAASIVNIAKEAQRAIAGSGQGASAQGTAQGAPAGLTGGWMEDFEAAKAQAVAQKRHMLLDFTGSDWCGWCIKLDKEVFEKPDFKAFSSEHLVLVKLDFPQRKAQDQKTKAQNASLQQKFHANGFPTIVLLDSAGVEIKRWSGFNANLLNELKAKVGSK